VRRIIQRTVKYALLGLLASVVLALLFVGIEVATEAFWGWQYEFSVAQRFLASFLTSAFLMVLFSTLAIVLSELTDGQE
jgi:hypothetical protein